MILILWARQLNSIIVVNYFRTPKIYIQYSSIVNNLKFVLFIFNFLYSLKRQNLYKTLDELFK